MVDVSFFLFTGFHAVLHTFLYVNQIFDLIMLDILVLCLLAVKESARSFHDAIISLVIFILSAGCMRVDVLVV